MLIINRKSEQPFNYAHSGVMIQTIKDLETKKIAKVDMVRSRGKLPEAVMLSKAAYDKMLVDATGPVPSVTEYVKTDDYMMVNAIKVLRVMTGEARRAVGHVMYAITTTANGRSPVRAYMLESEYYNELLALQP